MASTCIHYNYDSNITQSNCTKSFDECKTEKTCPVGASHYCFLLLTPETNGTGALVSSAGCISQPIMTLEGKCGTGECVGYSKGSRYFCCCTGDLCNSKFRLPSPQPLTSQNPKSIEFETNAQTTSQFIWISAVPLIVIVLAFYIRKYYKSAKKRKNRTDTDDDFFTINTTNVTCNKQHTLLTREAAGLDANSSFIDSQEDEVRLDLECIQLGENIGTGRFGSVFKATSNSNEVAVKVISNADCESWLNERQIYKLSKMKHNNILNFIFADKHPTNNSYWLILEYASKGSLHSHLKNNILSWELFIRIASGIARGLSHLHEANIVHRDFKSKNVLLKHDLTPCITDFGVAIVFEAPESSHLDQRKKYSQVGTPRYMAPEVLECSVFFTKSSFTKIDVYALSLVLWELLSRCHPLPTKDQLNIESPNSYNKFEGRGQYDSQPGTYHLPFEDKVGINPDINVMRDIVVFQKLRPTLKDEWRRHFPTNEICRAIEDGWEYDHDARISASCFVERLDSLAQNLK